MSEPAEPRVNVLTLRGSAITLAQAAKAAGLAASGGEAKHLIRSGAVRVNGTTESRPGRKLGPGDRFGTAAGPEWTVIADPNLPPPSQV